MRRALLPIVALGIALAGCGARPTAGSPAPRSTLTVSSTVSPGAGGQVFIEGALVEVSLLRADGKLVATKRSAGDKPMVFAGLSAGRYALEPVLRPCDGNCGMLDPPTGGCREAIDVPGTTAVVVHFVVGRNCTVSTTQAGG